MDAVFAFGVPVGCVMACGLVLDATRQTREVARDRRAWKAYAGERGFRYSNDTTTFSLRSHHRIDGHVGGLAVTCSTGTGILNMPTTTIRASAPAPIAGRVYVSCDDLFSRAQGDVLARRVDVPDPEFNGSAFIVRATEPQAVERVLPSPVRSLLLRMSESGRQSLNFRADHQELAVEWLGCELLPDLFDLGWSLMVAGFESRRRTVAYR